MQSIALRVLRIICSNPDAWHQAELNTQLCASDQLRTRRHSRAAVRLMNESVVRLDQRTALTFPEVEEKDFMV